jgi:hypothetical protein
MKLNEALLPPNMKADALMYEVKRGSRDRVLLRGY